MNRFVLSLVLLFTLTALTAHALVINEVEAIGNRRTPLENFSNLLVHSGSELDQQKLDDSIKNLYGTGFFSEITTDLKVKDGRVILTYILKEIPTVLGVELLVNNKVERTDRIFGDLGITIGSRLDLNKVIYAYQYLKNKYEKDQFYNVEVKYTIEDVKDDAVQIVFSVIEGKKYKVYNIWFYGNDNFSNEVLKSKLVTREKDFWSFFNSSGTLVKGAQDLDVQAIVDFYKDNGYVFVEVAEPEIIINKYDGKMNYVFRIQEGKQYFVDHLSYTDPKGIIDSDKLKEVTELKVGEPFNLSVYKRDMEQMALLYGDIGYADAFIDDDIDVNNSEATVSINYTVNSGEIYHINKINIVGNTKTYDNVIRREFDIYEGSLYNASLLEEGRLNAIRTDYFDDIQVKENNYAGSSDVNIEVKETAKPASLLLSLAYSKAYNVSGKIEARNKNLFGTGIEGTASIDVSSRRQSYFLSLYNPWVFDSKYSLGGSVYSQHDATDSNRKYDSKSVGAEIRIGRQIIKRRLFADLRIGREEVKIYDIDNDASKYIKRQEGRRSQNYITPGLIYSDLDSNIDPQDGFRATLSAEFSGLFLGGDTDMLKVIGTATYFKPLPYSLYGVVNGEIGNIWSLKSGEELPINKRFYKGGIDTIRGYSFRSISPVDAEGESYGGNKYYQLNLEVWRPLLEGGITVRAVAFFDLGMVYEEGKALFSEPPKKSVGLGLRYLTPFGLIRMEYGYKLDKIPGEGRGQFEFTVGSMF